MKIETRIKDLLVNHRKSYASLVTMYFMLFAVVSFSVLSTVWIVSDALTLKKNLKNIKTEYIDYQKKQVKIHTLNAVRVVENFKDDVNVKAYKNTVNHAQTLNRLFNTVTESRMLNGKNRFGILSDIASTYVSEKPLTNISLYQPSTGKTSYYYQVADSIRKNSDFIKTVVDSFKVGNKHKENRSILINWKKDNSDELFYIIYNKQSSLYILSSELLEYRRLEIQQEVLRELEKISFANDGYIFVNTYNGDALITNGKINNTPVNLWNLVDSENNKVIQMEREAAGKPDGDYIKYYWKKPEGSKPIAKISYIKGIDEWEWMLGAGFYLDNVNEVVKKQRNATIKSIFDEVLIVLVVLLFLLIMIFYFSRYLTKMTKINFQILNNFFQIAAKEASLINEDMLHFSEFKELASAVNSMIIERQKYEKEKAELERKSSALAMAVTASHEINQPLMILSGNIELLQLSLRNEKLTQKQRQHLEMIYKALARIQSILSMFKESNSVRFENYSDGTDMAILDNSDK